MESLGTGSGLDGCSVKPSPGSYGGRLSKCSVAGCRLGSFPKPANTCSQSSLTAPAPAPASTAFWADGPEKENPWVPASKLLNSSNCGALKESSGRASSSPRSSNMLSLFCAVNGLNDLSPDCAWAASSCSFTGLEILSWNSSSSLLSSGLGLPGAGISLETDGSSESFSVASWAGLVAGEYKSSSSASWSSASFFVVSGVSVVVLDSGSFSAICANSPGKLPGIV
ncbi:hypothetical protein OGATHE_004773 [Ogataea polymorpha]|uniref:Uncharacterized protein n=1 Tax=Ogataea polymorpha TaxID=460523 RepID=A0A9P8P0Y2_9ASCO|nr:hypothetical protein OGATHE_004773 [Ogataea polymorpha]